MVDAAPCYAFMLLRDDTRPYGMMMLRDLMMPRVMLFGIQARDVCCEMLARYFSLRFISLYCRRFHLSSLRLSRLPPLRFSFYADFFSRFAIDIFALITTFRYADAILRATPCCYASALHMLAMP